MAVVCLVEGTGLFIAAADRPLTDSHKYSAAAFATVLCSAGFFLLAKVFKQRRLHVWAGSSGIVLLENDALQEARWEDVVRVWDRKASKASGADLNSWLRAAAKGESRVITVETRGGEKLLLNKTAAR
jgi:hypothetical protein